MPHLFLLLAICSLVWAADPAPKPTPEPPAPAPAPAPAKPAVTPSAIATVQAYCQRANLAWNIEGAGPFRIVWVGDAKAPMPGMVEVGVKAMGLIEQWTGKTGGFVPEPLTEAAVCWMVVFPNAGSVHGLIDQLHFTDPAFAKKVGSFSLPGRVGVIPVEKLKEAGLHQCAYYAAVLSVDGWYAANVEKPTTRSAILLREGCAAETQRLLCTSTKVTTVAYEIGDHASDGGWARRIKALIAGKVPTYRAIPVRDAIDSTLDAMPISTYQEIWSVFCFLRDSTPKAKKGEENKLMRLFRATAAGTSASDAVWKVYGSAEPKLTQAWTAWAQQQKD